MPENIEVRQCGECDFEGSSNELQKHLFLTGHKKRAFFQSAREISDAELIPKAPIQQVNMTSQSTWHPNISAFKIHPVRLPPAGHYESCVNFGFWFRLLLFGGVGSFSLLGSVWAVVGAGAPVLSGTVGALFGTWFLILFLQMVLGIGGYSLTSFAMLCSALLTKFYLGEARATISEETLVAGDEFEFTYMQSFKRRTSVRKLRAQLMVRTESHYKTEVGADGEMGWMDEKEDKVLQEAQRPGWQAQPGEWSNDNAVFQIPDSALLSDIWLIKVHIRLNRFLMLERNYRLRRVRRTRWA